MLLCTLKYDFSKNQLECFWYCIVTGQTGCGVRLYMLCLDFTIDNQHTFVQSIFLFWAPPICSIYNVVD